MEPSTSSTLLAAEVFQFGAQTIVTRVYDSGSEIENTLARLRPDLFNADIENNHVIDQTVDHRSDNKVGVTMPELAGQSTCLPSTCSSTKIRNNVAGHLVREKGT